MRAAILLAAGSSRRFGSANKLMAPLKGRPLVLHALGAARAAPVGRLIVVTGAQSPRIAGAVRRTGVRATIVRARDHRDGLSASLRAGLAALWPAERSIFIFLGDMPDIPHLLAHRLALGMRRTRTRFIRPEWRGRPGHPVLLRRPSAEEQASLRGDRGLHMPAGAVLLAVRDAGAVRDIDRPGQIRRGEGAVVRFG